VIQDVRSPSAAADFLTFFADQVGMSPVWMCPLRLRGARDWPVSAEAGEVYVNFGFWGTVPLPRPSGRLPQPVDRKRVGALGGHKSLYSTSYYTRRLQPALQRRATKS